MRPGEMIARYGEDQFMALLPELDAATAQNLGERVRRTIVEMKIFSLDQHPLPSVTVSLGVAQMADEDTAETMIAAARTALSKARQE